MSEKELAKYLIGFLESQDYEIYQEVMFHSFGKVADIVAVRGPVFHIFECKKSLGLDVLAQASEWYSPFATAVVPTSLGGRSRMAAYRVAKEHYGVGVLEQERNSPELFRWAVYPSFKREYYERGKKMRSELLPEHKIYAEAGSNKRDHYTPYKGMIERLKKFIRLHEGCTIAEIFEEIGKSHYASDSSAKRSIAYALENFERDWCRVDRTEKMIRYFSTDK